MSEDPARETSAGGSIDYRQVSFVALATLALVVAALFAPGVADERSTGIEPDGRSPDGDGGGSGGERDGDGDSIPSFDWFEFFEWFDIDGDGGGEGNGIGEPAGDSKECVVALDGSPIPGSEVTATVYSRGSPLADVPVWFNDRSVGRTDEWGRVTGEVPYVETLEIRIGVDGVDCTATESTAWETSAAVAAAALPAQAVRERTASGGAPARGAAAATVQRAATTTAQTATDDGESNGTVEYEVDGSVAIRVLDDPYPGETVTIDAAIDGVPMRKATVSVDGDPVAETDETGTATITVPDDGSDRIDVGVARGDFAGQVTVDVLLLEARLVPGGLAPVPGSDGYVVAEIAGEPVRNAAVSVAGEDRGLTDEDGALAIDLPRDPTATVTVSTDSQTATVTLVGQYAALALVASVASGIAAAVTYRTRGRRGPIAVLVAAAGLLVVLVVEAFYGPVGGLVALGAVVAVGAGAVLITEGGPEPRAPAVSDAAGGFVAWLVDRALAAVRLLEALVDRCRRIAGAIRARLSTVPRSFRGLGLALLGWLRSLPARAIDLGRRGLARGRELPIRYLAAVAGAAGLLVAGYLVRGRLGAVVAAAVLAIVAAYVGRSNQEDEAPTADAAETVASPVANGSGAAEQRADRPSFRELWRSFAREVAPGRWRTRTPGEIERAALDAGYPREPVRELTTLFREVEYGDRPLSEELRTRADEAYRKLPREKPDRSEPDREANASTETTDGDRP